MLIKLFIYYEKLEVFSSNVVLVYRKLGLSLIYWFFAQLIYDPLISLILTFNNPIGQRFISITMSGVNLLAILVGGVVIIIASIMKKAQEISEENNLTI